MNYLNLFTFLTLCASAAVKVSVGVSVRTTVMYVTTTIYANTTTLHPSSSISSSSSTVLTSLSSVVPSQSPVPSVQPQPQPQVPVQQPGQGVFEDGKFPCTQFPAVEGMVAVNHVNHGGWTGIQIGNAHGQACTEGAYCSYRCVDGSAAQQWPADQPADGQTRGGLICRNGMLYKTRPEAPLCAPQAQGVKLVNQLKDGSMVSVCQTVYPGTENMVISTFTDGSKPTAELTTIIGESYFQWQGKMTSSQFYVQPRGVTPQTGCVWSSAGTNLGNFSPLNFGAGYSAGNYWVSLIPNPNGDAANLGYNVRIESDDPGAITCSIINGVYSGGANGCTVGSKTPPRFVLFD